MKPISPRLVVLFMAGWLGSGTALAQQRPHKPDEDAPGRPNVSERRPARARLAAQERDDSKPQRPFQNQRPDDARRPPVRPDAPGGLALHWPQDLPFRMTEQDRGPLAAGEGDELLNFARAEVPRVAQALERMRNERPAEFPKRLEQAAPRLRFLRRLFAENPRMARLFVKRAENEQDLNRMGRLWRASPDKPTQRRRIENELRRRLVENLRLDNQIMEARLAQLRETRAARIQADLERLTAANADLAGEAPEARRLVAVWQAAATPEEKRRVRARLQELMTQKIDDEIALVGERLERHRQEPAEEKVERRLQRLLNPAPPNVGAEPPDEP